jgi:hypothetical protein
VKKSKSEKKARQNRSAYCGDGCVAFVQREMKPFRAFVLQGISAQENDAKVRFSAWLSCCFSQFVVESCVFKSERNEMYLKCIDGNAALTKGNVIVGRFDDEYVYLKLVGCGLPYRVRLSDFLAKYQYANDDDAACCEEPQYVE